MKKVSIILLGMMIAVFAYSQSVHTETEDFDGTVSFTATPANSWVANTIYHLPGSSPTNPLSFLGLVPTQIGNTISLETPVYSCTGYDYALLRFSHICKVSPFDTARVEYRVGMGGGMGAWEPLPVGAYIGSSISFSTKGFSAESYPEWIADDNSKFPTQDWWQEEIFDLTGLVNQATVQFRFIITHGQIQGTQAAYGWLLDNFYFYASNDPLIPPTIELISPLVTGNVFSTGTWEINAKVKTNTTAPIRTSWLKWTATNNGVSQMDSVLMTLVSQSESSWKGKISQYAAGTEVVYSITGEDTLNNYRTSKFRYTIVQQNRNITVVQEGGNAVSGYYCPFAHNYGYSRSMALYSGTEINMDTPGEIYSIALRVVANPARGAFPMKIWLKTVPASKTTWDRTTDNQLFADAAIDAKLVYDGNFSFNALGWVDIPLDSVFYYDPTDNLVVMFEQNCGAANCYIWNGNSTAYAQYGVRSYADKLWLKWWDLGNTEPTLANIPNYYNIYQYRPDLRLGIIADIPDNSVIVEDIEIKDTIAISPNTNKPIAVTIRNKGTQLSSVKIAYSLNNANPIEKTLSFNPALPWDMSYTDTLGIYNPKMNDNDTIKVWVSTPNGNTNFLLRNDTLTKIIHGRPDITARFVNFPADTVNSTNPYEITADIHSFTGAAVVPVSLYVKTIFNDVTTTYDTLAMTNTSGNLWKAVIPGNVVKSDISCSIKLTDILGNPILLEGHYYIKGNYGGLNSAAITSINMSDTVSTSPSSSIPIVVTIANKGELDLDFVTVSYSINGSVPPVDTIVNLNPDLSWNFTSQSTVGAYKPKANGKDTIKVSVSLPNGQTDATSNDDTFTKIIYGSSDIVLRFTSVPADTVTFIGPHEITAQIYSLSGAALGTVSLLVTSTAAGTTTYDTLPMANTSGNLWKATIPRKRYNNAVSYTIKLTDKLGNYIEIENNYYIKGKSPGYVIMGTGTTTNYYTPTNLYYQYGFSRQLYLGTEFSSMAVGGTITKLAWDYFTGAPFNQTNQSCYFKAVDEADIASSAYVDPMTDGATLVWQGTLSATAAGWVEITLDAPFVLPPGKNLLIYWNNQHGARISNYTWRHTNTAFYSTVRGHSTTSFTALAGLNRNYARANARFYYMEPTDSNSIALVSINSPENAKTVLAGTLVPVKVTIQNRGINDLDSCEINWSLNGQIQSSYTYYGNLPEEFTDTLIIGSYLPTTNKWDTIVAWVSLPNGVPSSNTTDDTSKVTTLGCTIFSGIIKVGAGENFVSINEVLNLIRFCGVSGDITLALKGAFPENVDLSGFEDYMGGYALTITSFDNNADSAIIQPASGVGITLSRVRNFTVKNITVNTSATGANAIQFTGACTNIVIRDCKLISDTVSASTSGGVVYKASNTGVVDSIFVINNLLEGGFSGFYFYGGTGYSLYGKHVVVDSNVVKNNRQHGIYFYYTDFISCSNNTILCRTANMGTAWHPLDIIYSNGDVTYNRIIKREAATVTTSNGIYSNNHNTYQTTAKALIANNEIIHTNIPSGSGTIYAGIYLISSMSEILHNSIYMSGERDVRGIYVSSAVDNADIMNNNIVVISSSGYPFYITGGGTYNIDYNNLYGSVYVGYHGSDITDMETWRKLVPTDLHSVSLLPKFVDEPPTNLNPTVYRELFCPLIASVSDDIEKVSRYSTTTMGAYTRDVVNQDLTLLSLSSWSTKIIASQTVQVNVEVLNTGISALTNVTFGWKLNGVVKTPANWTPTSALGSFEQESDIPIGAFDASSDTAFDVVVWIESINGQADIVHWEDTVSGMAVVVPMVEFAAPFVADTIVNLSFNINAVIIDVTGAPVTPPMLQLEAIIGANAYHVYDSVAMVGSATGGIWTVTIPKQYYETKVIYHLMITDTTGYTLTVKDSVYIKYPDFGRVDETVIGVKVPNVPCEGAMSNQNGYETPINPSYPYNWSRQLYLFDEVCPSGSTLGTYVKKIAWESNTVAGSWSNQTCFMRATDDTELAPAEYITVPYVDPYDPANNYQRVYQGSITVNQGSWAEIVLDAPFYLPYGKTLDIQWHNESGRTVNTGFWCQLFTKNGKFMSTSARGSGSLPQIPNIYGAKAFRTNLKVTTEDGAAFESYLGNDLGLVNLVSPLNSVGCLPDFSPIRVNLRNLGERSYVFSRDSVILHAEVIDPYHVKHILSNVLNTGTFASGEMRTIEFSSSFPVMNAGAYEIKMWIESPIDQMVYDDTLYYVYQSGRTGLPVEDDFSGGILSDQIISYCILPEGGSEKWAPYTDPSSTIPLPPEGNGMLRYVGDHGTMSRIRTRQLDLYRVSDPQLSFWYYYDSSASDLDNSYTEVSVMVDDVSAYVKTLYRKGAITGWVKDSIDLMPYITAECVYVQFETMNKYDSLSAQYLGLISITSTPDLEVSSILVSPEIDLCNFTNKNLYVVLSTTMNQTIDFSVNEPDLEVEVGTQTFTYPLRHIIQGNSSDTILIQSNLDLKDIRNIKAYLTVPVDRYAVNDTTNLVLDINPGLSVIINPVTDANSCAKKGSEIEQEIILQNTGNMDIEEIELLLLIDIIPPQIIRDTLTTLLKAGETVSYTFKNKYIAPDAMDYPVRVLAWLKCDSALVNTIDEIQECVDLHNISVLSIDNPLADQTNNVGSTDNIVVSVKNESDNKRYTSIIVTALIENVEGIMIANRLGTIPVIEPFDTVQFTFAEKYSVPSDSVYTIRVYLNNLDIYPEDDTLSITCYTRDTTDTEPKPGINSIKGTNAFTLGQNIPNPATNSTRIDYSVPEAGEVIFHVHSISGQLLYSETINTKHGTNSIELNTSTFAAGVYFYSMEYKGQRLVRQLIINVTN
jgi:hypothetical protein